MATTHYVWDPEFDCITKETDAAGAITARYTQEPKLYGGLVSQRRSGATSIYHYDAIGTTRTLTDSGQNVTDTAVYTAFGENVASTGATVNPFGYVGMLGYYTNATVNSLSVRNRAYRTTLARWLARDPIHYLFGELNWYTYCRLSPAIRRDPTGLSSTLGDELAPLPSPLPTLPDKGEKCTCDEFIKDRNTVVDGPGDTKCKVTVLCKIRCPTGLPGEASFPDENGNIEICMTSMKTTREYALVFEHEMQHARDFCKKPPPKTGYSCEDCKKYESHAHEVNCGMLYPSDEAKRKSCVDCGTYISCKHMCPGSKKPDGCSWELLGVDPVGKEPIPNTAPKIKKR